MRDPDPGLVWATLSEAERAVFGEVVRELGFEPGDWPAVRPLRVLLPLVAVLRMAASIEGVSDMDAARLAAEALGLEDDPDRDSAHHPADRYRRTLSRWLTAAEEASGQIDQSSDSEAA